MALRDYFESTVQTPDRSLGVRPRGEDDPKNYAQKLQSPPTFSAVEMAGRFAGECLPLLLLCFVCICGGVEERV